MYYAMTDQTCSSTYTLILIMLAILMSASKSKHMYSCSKELSTGARSN